MTFSEILLVLAVAVIFLLSILPSVGQASGPSQAALLHHQLKALQTQIEIYRYNHEDVWPTADISKQLTSRTDLAGEISQDGSCGPYFADGIPANPFNGRDDIGVASPLSSAAANGSYGWLYDAQTGMIVPGDSAATYQAFGGP